MYVRNENVRIFSSKNIHSVNAIGIVFSNERRETEQIELEQCYKESILLKNGNLDSYNPDTDEWKWVGERNVLGKPPYILFYANPSIRFDFISSNELRAFRVRLKEFGGWITLDMI